MQKKLLLLANSGNPTMVQYSVVELSAARDPRRRLAATRGPWQQPQ